MVCERYLNAIHELIDGTLGPIRRAELELHLESCDDCRALVEDLREIARATESLETIHPPARVWPRIAARLQQEGLAQAPPPRPSWRQSRVVLPLAAALLLAVGASLFALWPGRHIPAAAPQQQATTETATATGSSAETGNAQPSDPVQGFDAALGTLEDVVEQATKLNDSLDPQTQAEVQKNLLVINEAVQATRAALKTDPDNEAAQQTLYETLKQKIRFLQNTITLMNEMRQGDAAGAAQIVEGGKS